MIKKIWHDPVGSKVIAWVIIGILTLVGVAIKSSYDEKSFYETLLWFFNFPIPIYAILIALVTLVLIRKIIKRKKQFYNSKQRKLREFNYSIDTERNIRTEWTVYFGSNGKPFITDLEFFCLEHGNVPIRLFNNRCSHIGCKNASLNFNTFELKNYFESLVINEWNKLNR